MTHPTIKFGPHCGSSFENSKITLATSDPKSHLNIYVQTDARRESLGQCICAAPEDAIRLRDELLKMYPLPQQDITRELKAAEEHGRANGHSSGFDIGHQIGYLEGQASAKPKPGKWETVGNGLDRMKIDGGYVYQNEAEELVFVPNQPNATTSNPLCTLKGKCGWQSKA